MNEYQVMPPLTDEEYAALKTDIAQRGVLVPVLVDQHGNTLDGHHRQHIASELGIDYPTEVRQVADDGEARDVAFTLNLARRHLTREQKRALIAAELERDPAATDRSIARRLKCSPSTVGAVRRPVSNLDTSRMTREEAQARTARIRDLLTSIREDQSWLRDLVDSVDPGDRKRFAVDVGLDLDDLYGRDWADDLLDRAEALASGPRG